MAVIAAVGSGSGLPGWIYLVQGRKTEVDLDCVEAGEQFNCHGDRSRLVSGRERRTRADVLLEERLIVTIEAEQCRSRS